MTIPACTTPPINWIRCRDVRFSHLLLRKTKDRWGAVDTSVSGRSINEDSPQRSSIHLPASLGATTCFLQRPSRSFFLPLSFKQRAECSCRTDTSELMDTQCVITHQHRCTRSTRGRSARCQRSLPVENLSLLMLCSPSQRTQPAAGRVLLSAERNINQQHQFCLSLDT